MKWYEKAIPRVKDILPFVKDLARKISQKEDVNSVYAWGLFAEKYTNLNIVSKI